MSNLHPLYRLLLGNRFILVDSELMVTVDGNQVASWIYCSRATSTTLTYSGSFDWPASPQLLNNILLNAVLKNHTILYHTCSVHVLGIHRLEVKLIIALPVAETTSAPSVDALIQ